MKINLLPPRRGGGSLGIVAALLAALFVLTAVGCSHWTYAGLTVDNRSSQPLTDVHIFFAVNRRAIERISSGKSATRTDWFSREGNLCVSYRRDRKPAAFYLSYLGTDLNLHCWLTVKDDAVTSRCWHLTGPFFDRSPEERLEPSGRVSCDSR